MIPRFKAPSLTLNPDIFLARFHCCCATASLNASSCRCAVLSPFLMRFSMTWVNFSISASVNGLSSLSPANSQPIPVHLAKNCSGFANIFKSRFHVASSLFPLSRLASFQSSFSTASLNLAAIFLTDLDFGAILSNLSVAALISFSVMGLLFGFGPNISPISPITGSLRTFFPNFVINDSVFFPDIDLANGQFSSATASLNLLNALIAILSPLLIRFCIFLVKASICF